MVWDPSQPFDPNQQLNQDPTQGQAPPQNQGQPSPSQAPPVPQGGDPYEPIKQGLAQRIAQYQQQQNAPANNGGAFKRILGNFFQSAAAAGLQHVGLPTPYEQNQRNIQNLNAIQTAQSTAQLHQAMAGMYGTVPVQVIDPENPGQFKTVMVQQKDAASVLKSQISAGARTGAAQIGANAKLNVAQLQLAAAQGMVSKITPAQDENGNFVMRAINKYGQPIGDIQGALPPASYLSRTSNTVEYKEDADGNIVALPKTTVSRPNLPGGPSPNAAPQRAPAAGPPGATPPSLGRPTGIQGKVPDMAFGTDNSGSQVAGTPSELKAAGVSNATKLPSSEAAKVNIARQLVGPNGLFDLAQKDLAAFKPGELEALAPRWNEFMAGTIGNGDPRYVALRTHVNGLLSTALLQAHMGSTGRVAMVEKFQGLADAGKMNKETLTAALNAEKQYVQEKAMRPKAPTPNAPTGGFAAWKASQR